MQNEITHTPTGNNTTESLISPAQSSEQKLSRSEERKVRAKALLNQLTRPQRQQVLLWLHELPVSDVLELVTAPPPKGLGIQTHYTTLHRLKNHLRSDRVSYDLRNLTEVCRDIATDNPALDLGKVQSVLSAILHDRLFQLLEKSTDVTDINKLIDAISKFSALEFKRQNLARDQQLSHGTKHHRVDLNIVSPARLQPANAVNISCDPPAALPQISKPGSDRPDSEPV